MVGLVEFHHPANQTRFASGTSPGPDRLVATSCFSSDDRGSCDGPFSRFIPTATRETIDVENLFEKAKHDGHPIAQVAAYDFKLSLSLGTPINAPPASKDRRNQPEVAETKLCFVRCHWRRFYTENHRQLRRCPLARNTIITNTRVEIGETVNTSTGIEWTDATWNPVTGCTKTSPGCAHCYAEAVTLRFKRGPAFLPAVAKVVLHEDRLGQPLSWRGPRRIFVNSMSDLFHDDVPFEFIERVFNIMGKASWHTFQVLTKRHVRLQQIASRLAWPPNVWIGVSVENQVWADERIPALASVPAAVRFLSCEPLLKQVDLAGHLESISWVILGGESGPKARPMNPEWVELIRDQCVAAEVPFFFKQWGGVRRKIHGNSLGGRTWQEFPTSVAASA